MSGILLLLKLVEGFPGGGSRKSVGVWRLCYRVIIDPTQFEVSLFLPYQWMVISSCCIVEAAVLCCGNTNTCVLRDSTCSYTTQTHKHHLRRATHFYTPSMTPVLTCQAWSYRQQTAEWIYVRLLDLLYLIIRVGPTIREKTSHIKMWKSTKLPGKLWIIIRFRNLTYPWYLVGRKFPKNQNIRYFNLSTVTTNLHQISFTKWLVNNNIIVVVVVSTIGIVRISS